MTKPYREVPADSMGELGYLNLLQDIMQHGEQKMERNGMTRKLVGSTLTMDLLNHPFPLFVSKKMFWKGIVAELDFFLNGVSDIRYLWNRNVHIWDGDWEKFARKHQTEAWVNSVMDSCNKRDNISRMKDIRYNMGNIYGVQWRGCNRFGVLGFTEDLGRPHAPDQFSKLLESVANGGTRRDIVDAWNPSELSDMTLPPCHILWQVHRNGDYLDMTMYQRSADMFLGVPFNVTSYATLLQLIAKLTGLKARKLVMMFADAHIYEAHFDAVNEQIDRYQYVRDLYQGHGLNQEMSPVMVFDEVPYRGGTIGEFFWDKSEDKDKYAFNLFNEKKSYMVSIQNYAPLDAIKAPLLT